MTHARESITMIVKQMVVVACSLGITVRIVAASLVFGMVHGPPDPDRETAIPISIAGLSIIAECWSVIDELQAGLLGIAALVFFYELHEFTAEGNLIVVSYLVLNVGVVLLAGFVQAGQAVMYSLRTNNAVFTYQP